MIPYFATAGVEIYHGDCRDVLRALPAASVQTCVTSPPYFGLRDYGTATWEGGDPACNHEPDPEWLHTQFHAKSGLSGNGDSKSQSAAAKTRWYRPDGSCRCGARRKDQQIGLEPTPAEYVATMVEVFGEVRRVLRDDGTVWLNLGDSYNAYNGNRGTESLYCGDNLKRCTPEFPAGNGLAVKSLKPKDLIGIPWSVAFALRDDGWYLRSDIIWHKPNPMPESVTDRPTKAHEYLFLLAKNERYYYDHAAILEPFADDRMGNPGNYTDRYSIGSGRNDSGRKNCEWLKGEEQGGRNKRSVWTVNPRPYKNCHFATFPPDLIEPCILAGSKPGDAVLDPFNGSGTTGEVCQKWGRRYVGIELNQSYIDLSAERFRQHVLFSPEVA